MDPAISTNRSLDYLLDLGASNGASELPAFLRDESTLFSIVNTLATLFGGSVVIEGNDRSVIAYSTIEGQRIDAVRTEGILARKVPDDPVNDDQYREVQKANEAVRFAGEAHISARIATAIRAGRYPLGSLWIVDPTPNIPISTEQQTILQFMSTMAATSMLHHMNAGLSSRQPGELSLRALLSGSQISQREWRHLGIEEELPALLIGVAVRPAGDLEQIHRAMKIVQQQTAAFNPQAITTIHENIIYTMLPMPPATVPSMLVRSLTAVLEGNTTSRVLITLPGTTPDPGGIHGLSLITQRLLSLGERHIVNSSAQTIIMPIDEYRPELFLDEIRALQLKSRYLNNPEVTALTRDAPLIAKTLRSWFEHFGNVSKTAKALGIHENTVRYRVNQSELRLSHSLSDPNRKLHTWLQLAADDEH